MFARAAAAILLPCASIACSASTPKAVMDAGNHAQANAQRHLQPVFQPLDTSLRSGIQKAKAAVQAD